MNAYEYMRTSKHTLIHISMRIRINVCIYMNTCIHEHIHEYVCMHIKYKQNNDKQSTQTCV